VTTWDDLDAGVTALAAAWRNDRRERQARRHLDPADFARLHETGFLRVVVPESRGGLWRSVAETTRPIASALRTLASADPSVALVSSMHPAVVGFWLSRADATAPAWVAQFDAVVATVEAGKQWGTITSEPGSGGDIARTTSLAEPTDDGPDLGLPGAAHRITGDKHFGSGSGIVDLMITTAVAEGDRPMFFVIDGHGEDGRSLVAEWDGMGMAATQSHAMRFERCPAVRMAWDGPIEEVTLAAGPLVSMLFTAVVLGVLDEAVATAKAQLAPKAELLRPYERVEWTRAEAEHWLAVQAFDGALRTVERGDGMASLHAGLRAKTTVAELAESVLTRLTRVIGGGTFSRRSPFSAWFEDVRALGFLRPPWGLAYDNLFTTSFIEPA
jgi:alkylation response protein AidB-like acyl-CoA dehydrogenase